MKEGNIFGLHRVITPEGVLPQPAEKIDNTMDIYDNEILIDVETLNIDSASFTQIKSAAAGDIEKIKYGTYARRGYEESKRLEKISYRLREKLNEKRKRRTANS